MFEEFDVSLLNCLPPPKFATSFDISVVKISCSSVTPTALKINTTTNASYFLVRALAIRPDEGVTLETSALKLLTVVTLRCQLSVFSYLPPLFIIHLDNFQELKRCFLFCFVFVFVCLFFLPRTYVARMISIFPFSRLSCTSVTKAN